MQERKRTSRSESNSHQFNPSGRRNQHWSCHLTDDESHRLKPGDACIAAMFSERVTEVEDQLDAAVWKQAFRGGLSLARAFKQPEALNVI